MVPINIMFYKKLALLLILIIPASNRLHAQGQALDMAYYQTLQKAERLQNSGNYQAAYQKWQGLDPQDLSLDQKAQRAFNMAYLGLVAGYKDAPGAMRRFVRDFPSAPEVNRAYTMVGHYYFTKAQYANALAWYKEAESFNQLSNQHRYEIAFANFKLGNTAESARFFSPLITDAEYGPRAVYYLAFIEYKNKNWTQALSGLASLDDTERDELQAWSLMADLAFRVENYSKAAEWGIRALDGLKISGDKRNINKTSLSGIVGRAYWHLAAHSLAIEYLEQAVGSFSRGKERAEDVENQFYLGQSYAALGQNLKAVAVLNQIKDGGPLTADVAYVLAGAYLAMDQKTEALNAYKKAASTEFDRPFSAQAHYQYAKLTYDLRLSYTSVAQELESFILRYPKHPKRAEVEQWWLSSLLESKDYDQVIAFLSETSLLLENEVGNKRQMALQRAYLLKGRQEYDLGLSTNALKSFDAAEKINSRTLMGAQALFWSAVINNESGAYEKSLKILKRLKANTSFDQASEWGLISFELGYASMALKRYESAQSEFLNYLEQEGSLPKENEARLNLADCYFATKNYSQALIQYEKVIALSQANEDYANYQAAMCLEFTQGLEAKALRLGRFLKSFPYSVYRDDVLLSLGRAYVNLDKILEAQTQFQTLISTSKNSPLAASAYLNLGLISDNNREFEQALEYYKTVVDLFPGTQEAISAVQSARNTFISLGRVQEYGQWVNDLDFISIEEAVLDQASFESAKQAYAQGEDSLGIQRFEVYLENYPQGRYTLEAHYFLSEIYWRKQNVAQALIHAEPVINSDQNPSYIIPTLIRVSRHYISSQEFELAENNLIQLLNQPLDADQRTFALRNLMQLNSDSSRWEQTRDYAQQLIGHLSVGGDAALITQAKFLVAWSHFELGAFELAREQYDALDGLARGLYGAQYTLAQAYFAYLDQDYSGSNVLIQNLAQNYANFPIYGARGLMIMALNFEALSDPFQARFILENIRDNMNDFPDLQQEAINRLEKMEREKNQNLEVLNQEKVHSGLDNNIKHDSLGPKIKNQKPQND